MATSVLRDPAGLADGLTRWLSGPGRTVAEGPVRSVTHASAGWANETVVVAGGPEGAPAWRLVVRLPALRPTFPAYDLHQQAAVQAAVAAAGVPAPVPAVVEDDEAFLGAPFMVMPFVEGHIPAQVPSFDRWVTGRDAAGQRQVLDAFVDTLAAVHAVDWRAAGLGARLRGAGGLDEELDWWGHYLGWAADGRPLPTLAAALAWCRRHRPSPAGDPVLLWGDPRLGNLVFDEGAGVRAVLDWELAALGPAEVDLGWYLGQDLAMGELVGRPVPGFYGTEGLLDRYRAAGGRLEGGDLGWYVVFGLFRSVAVDDRQSRLAAVAGVPYPTPPDESSPLVGVLRKLVESR